MELPTEQCLQSLGEDEFGYDSLSERILDNVLLKMKLPNCFGLYGNWGSGKSTMIRFIKSRLESSSEEYKKVAPIFFEPWKYEYSDHKDLMFALLNAIKVQSDVENPKWKQLMIDAAAIASGVLKARQLVDMQAVKADIELLESKAFNEHERWVDKVEKFGSEFEGVIDDILKKKRATKMFIFVDDLDRCLPENAIKLLEGIKNFLSTNNVLFILAIDRRVVSEMIEKKYGLHDGYGDEYLTKIVHYYYELPAVDLASVTVHILDEYDIETSGQELNYIVRFLSDQAREPRLTKHILHQLGLRVMLSCARDKVETFSLRHVFVASFLLTRFAKLFSIEEPRGLLTSVRSSAYSAMHEPDSVQHKMAKQSYPIAGQMRKALEVIIRLGISDKIMSPEDIDSIARAMTVLRGN
jgi:energy-coupling factor transporter ATP-binding protein EcfA2